MIRLDRVSFTYGIEQGQRPVPAVRALSMAVAAGEHVALIGRNGSGKSTIARLMNGLLIPDEGTVTVNGMVTTDDDRLYDIRRSVGMVFQNPDNQIIGATVRDDVAFGPSNLGLPVEDILERVRRALEVTGLTAMADRAPHELSGGQKQKLAIASALAMHPDAIVLDEATAMLDPQARGDVIELIRQIRETMGLTVVNITHHMREASLADRIYVIDAGRIVLSGTPAEVFDQPERLMAAGLDLPVHMALAQRVRAMTRHPYDREAVTTPEGAATYIRDALRHRPADGGDAAPPAAEDAALPLWRADRALRMRNVHFAYEAVDGTSVPALTDISFDVQKGEVLGIVGHTGSGKSTLVQHMNGIIPAEPGTVEVLGRDLGDRKNVRAVRPRVGLLFQYPEDQLFEETVALDVAFAPKQFGKTPEQVERAVLSAVRRMNIEDLLDRSPFELSGGQRRRVAIAGVLAAEPEIIVLDEPTAGLDPGAQRALWADLMSLRDEGATLIIVSHDMEQIAEVADQMLVLEAGRIARMGCPEDVTDDPAWLERVGLAMPAAKAMVLAVTGDAALASDAFTIDRAVLRLLRWADRERGTP